MKTIKVWGTREILFKNNTVFVTLLNLIGGTYSSLHNHKCKSDKFVLILGKVKIVTEIGETILFPGQSLIIDPPLLHQFVVEENSIMIEISSTVLDPEDINRVFQGGKIVDGKMISLDDLNKQAKERGVVCHT